MLSTFQARIRAITVKNMVETRVRTSSLRSLRRGQIEPITLLQSSEEPARRELSAELMIAETSAARKSVSSSG